MLSDYQLKIADLYNISIGNVKKLVPNFFDKEKYDWLWKLATLLKTRIEATQKKEKKQKKMVTKTEKRCAN